MADFDDKEWHPKQRRRRMLLALAGAGLGLAGWYAWGKYDRYAREEEMRAVIAAAARRRPMLVEARRTAEEASVPWRAAIRAVSAEALAGAAPCPVDVPSTTLTAIGAALDKTAIDVSGGMPATVLHARELGTHLSPSAGRFLRRVRETKGDLGDTGSAPRPPGPGAAGGWGPDLTIVIEEEDKAGAANFDAGTFEGGTRVGHAYVYDYGAGAVVCAGRFVAGSSGQLEVRGPRPKDSFETVAGFDLDFNSVQAAVASLRAVRRAAPPR